MIILILFLLLNINNVNACELNITKQEAENFIENKKITKENYELLLNKCYEMKDLTIIQVNNFVLVYDKDTNILVKKFFIKNS